MMRASKNAIDLIILSEGFRSEPYLCEAGKPTIGYGSTFYPSGEKVTLQDKAISKEEAIKLLEHMVEFEFNKIINESVKVTLNQNQFDALISFAYNAGEGNFKKSTLLKKVNVKDFIGASYEFPKWIRAKGKVLSGLVNRRERERQLFLQG